MSAWHQAGQGSLCSLLSHAGHYQLGKTPGSGAIIRAVPCAQHPPQCREEGELGARLGGPATVQEKPGDVSCLFSLYLALAISIFQCVNIPRACPYVV